MKILITILLVFLSLSSKNAEIVTNEISTANADFSGMTVYEIEIRQTLTEENVEPYTIELIVAQSKFESGNYKNSLVKYNNIFARHYFKADTFAISAGAQAEGHSRFSKYPSIRYATLSQLWYFKRKNYSMNWKSTYQFALECKRKGYYEAPLYEYKKGLDYYFTPDRLGEN